MSGPPSKKRRGHTGESHEDIEVTEVSPTGKAEKLELFSLEKRILKGKLTNVKKYLRGGCKEGGVRLFSLMSHDRTRGNGNKETQKALSEHRETAFYYEGD